MAAIRFGGCTFSSETDFTVVGQTQDGGLGIGFFGPPPPTRFVWVSIANGALLLNADFADADGEVVVTIRDNVVTFNRDNIYSVETFPPNQIPPDRVVVTNQYGETALDLNRQGATWDLNADFRYGDWHVVATPDGMRINPPNPHV